MIKKLFLTAKVLAFVFVLYVVIYQSLIIYNNYDDASARDVIIYRSKPFVQQVTENMTDKPTDFELSLVISDKQKNLFNFADYNYEPLVKTIFVLLAFASIFIFEKWHKTHFN